MGVKSFYAVKQLEIISEMYTKRREYKEKWSSFTNGLH